MVAPTGYIAQVNDKVCEACRAFEDVCPFVAIRVNKTAFIN